MLILYYYNLKINRASTTALLSPTLLFWAPLISISVSPGSLVLFYPSLFREVLQIIPISFKLLSLTKFHLLILYLSLALCLLVSAHKMMYFLGLNFSLRILQCINCLRLWLRDRLEGMDCSSESCI